MSAINAIAAPSDPRHPTPGDVLRMTVAWLARHSTGARHLAETRRLRAMSDAELSSRGLRRDTILRHVFSRNAGN